jgi:hypothetical protein
MSDHSYLLIYCPHTIVPRMPLKNIKFVNIIAPNEADAIRKFVELSSNNSSIRRFIYQYLTHNSNNIIAKRLINRDFADEIEFISLMDRFIEKHLATIVEILRNGDDDLFHLTELSDPIFTYKPRNSSRLSFLRNEYYF